MNEEAYAKARAEIQEELEAFCAPQPPGTSGVMALSLSDQLGRLWLAAEVEPGSKAAAEIKEQYERDAAGVLGRMHAA